VCKLLTVPEHKNQLIQINFTQNYRKKHIRMSDTKFANVIRHGLVYNLKVQKIKQKKYCFVQNLRIFVNLWE